MSNLDDFFQPPSRSMPLPRQSLEGTGSTPLTTPLTTPSYRSQSNHSSARSFLATSIHDQQTAPHSFLPGPNGRKGRMLLGAGFEPPSQQYTAKTMNESNQRVSQRNSRYEDRMNQRMTKPIIVSANNIRSHRIVDRTSAQRYAFSPRERESVVAALVERGEGDSGRRGGYNAPRTQNKDFGSWSYRDRTLARYRQYGPNWDQPDPRRPMARTEEQMRRKQWPALEDTTLCQHRRQVVNVQPPVRQSFFTGDNQYQHRMMAARKHLGGVGVDKVLSSSPRVSPRESPRESHRSLRESPRLIRVGPNSNFRHAALGPLATCGKFELMNAGATYASSPVFSRKSGPIPIPQGPILGMMQKPPAPDFQQASDPWGSSLKHGRKDRVATWQNPLTCRRYA